MLRAAAVVLVLVLSGCGSSYDPDDPLTPDYEIRDRYAGKDCSEIGREYEIEPGVDPEHDLDGDGLACESEAPSSGFGTPEAFPNEGF